MQSLLVILSLLAGAGLALQAAANAQLSKSVGSPLAATTLQLCIGAIVLLLLTLATATAGAFGRLPQATWWHLLGGTASALYVVSTILLFPRIGAVTAVGLIIAGQVLASLVLDVFGFLGVPALGLRAGLIIGALLVIGGAVLIVRGKVGKAEARPEPKWIALALLAGAVLPVQGAINALLRPELDGAAFAVGTVSFVVAMLTMAAVFLTTEWARGQSKASLSGLAGMPWWGWLGGLAGAAYVTTVFVALPVIGAGATVALTVAGQQAASLAVDQLGLLRLPQRAVSGMRLFGVAMLLPGIVAIKAL
jgi:transporter family-2 protein